MADGFNHTQTTSSSTWTISHNLNTTAIVIDVFVDDSGDLKKILPNTVVHTDDNTCTVTFTSNRTGRARVIG